MIPNKIATIFVTILLVFAGLWPLPDAFADDPRARAIMEKVDAGMTATTRPPIWK